MTALNEENDQSQPEPLAFPRAGHAGNIHTPDGVRSVHAEPEAGMTLRDYFAAHATPFPEETDIVYMNDLAGYSMPSPGNHIGLMEWEAAADARRRYILADAMLAERSLPNGRKGR